MSIVSYAIEHAEKHITRGDYALAGNDDNGEPLTYLHHGKPQGPNEVGAYNAYEEAVSYGRMTAEIEDAEGQPVRVQVFAIKPELAKALYQQAAILMKRGSMLELAAQKYSEAKHYLPNLPDLFSC